MKMSMSDKLEKIWDHFGEKTQLEKLQEEVGELIEAVREGDREHIVEEIADVLVLVDQIIEQHNIIQTEILEVFVPKVDRTLKRIANRYYENGEAK